MNNLAPMRNCSGVQGRLNWMPGITLDMLFSSGKCNSSYTDLFVQLQLNPQLF